MNPKQAIDALLENKRITLSNAWLKRNPPPYNTHCQKLYKWTNEKDAATQKFQQAWQRKNPPPKRDQNAAAQERAWLNDRDAYNARLEQQSLEILARAGKEDPKALIQEIKELS